MSAARPEVDEAMLSLDADQLTRLSHELRSPLASVLGWAELLIDADPPLAAGAARLVAAIQRGALRQARLLDNLAVLADLHSRQVPRVREPVTLAALLADLPKALAAELDSARVGLHVALPPVEAATTGDQHRLRQAVQEVVRNGVQASAAGGLVTVVAGGEPTLVGIEVADHGHGIPAEELPGILAPFGRTGHARRTHLPGAGLGLAVADGVLRAHGGTLEITSTPGTGTLVRITLPAA